MKKKHFYYCIILFFCIVGTSNCKKDSSSNIAILQAKVDGSLVICDSIVRLPKSLGGTLYGIEGYKKGGGYFKLLFPIGSGVGTYTFLLSSAVYENEGWFSYDSNNQFKSTSGSVIVTVATGKKFKGTFSFPAQSYIGDTKTITEGEFEIDY